MTDTYVYTDVRGWICLFLYLFAMVVFNGKKGHSPVHGTGTDFAEIR